MTLTGFDRRLELIRQKSSKAALAITLAITFCTHERQ
jgi:hypothetical protein